MDAVEDIKSRLNIEDVIGKYVELKRSGRNFKGMSPFSSEKTPSFIVSPEKQIWHDFSSGKGGNMFSFVMEMEGLDFKGALEMLARQAGVDLDQYKTSSTGSRTQQKERLYQVLELASKFYQIHFTKNRAALEYILKTRNYSKQTALEFKIGYAPENDNALVVFLRSKNFTDQEIKLAGLSTKHYKDARDMFRGRIMIPLMDTQGRVIGFTARLLLDNPNAPKYINTPQTILYDKSRHVFGLNLAKDAIRKQKYAVLVEGNLDVIASHQAGVKNVVATAGTALTEQHLKAMTYFTNDVRLAFDQDKAGLQATERALPIASKAGVSLGIITIPTGKDPDELIQKDSAMWQKIIDKPQYAIDWLIGRYQTILDLNSAPGKREFSNILLNVIKSLSDSVEQDHYIVRIAELIRVSPDALRSKLTNSTVVKQPILKRHVNVEQSSATNIDWLKTENHLLALFLHHQELRSVMDIIKPEMIVEESAKNLLLFLQKNLDFDMSKQANTLPSKISDFVKTMLLLHEELYQGLEITELQYEAARLRTRLVEHYVKSQKIVIASTMNNSDDTKTKELLEQAKELDMLLRKVQ